MGRAPCCDKANVKRGPWSPEEDAALRSYIQKHGTGGNWIALPHKAGLKRCGKSCRLRWLNYLRPDIKHGGFTDEEDNIICAIYSKLGSRWSIIASYLPGRTDNDVKNYWNTKLKKKLIANQTNLFTTITSGITSPSQTPPPKLLSTPPAGLLVTIKPESHNSNGPLIAQELNSVLAQDCSKLYSEIQQFTMSGLMQQPSSTSCINNGNLDEVSATSSPPIAIDNYISNGYLEYSGNGFSSDDKLLMELGFAGEPAEGLMFGYGCQEKLGEVAPFCFSGLDSIKAAIETKPQGPFQSFTHYS